MNSKYLKTLYSCRESHRALVLLLLVYRGLCKNRCRGVHTVGGAKVKCFRVMLRAPATSHTMSHTVVTCDDCLDIMLPGWGWLKLNAHGEEQERAVLGVAG